MSTENSEFQRLVKAVAQELDGKAVFKEILDVEERHLDWLVKALEKRINGKLAYTVQEAAEATGASQWRIRQAIQRKEIQAKTDQSPWLVPRKSLEKWLEE